MKKNSIQWFLRGFGLSLMVAVVAIAAIVPMIGLAQGGTGNLDALFQSQDDSDPPVRFTDDPQGRILIPIEEKAGVPQDNLQEVERSRAKEGEVADPRASVEAQVLETAAINAPQAYGSPLIISAADFGADGANPGSFFFPFGGGYMQGDANNYGCLVAPAYLPNNATVQDMFATVYDNDTSYDISVSLRRVDNFNGGTVTMATGSTAGDFAGIQVVSDGTIDEPVVVYPDYAYYVTTCVLSSNIRIYSVRIYYTTP